MASTSPGHATQRATTLLAVLAPKPLAATLPGLSVYALTLSVTVPP